MSHRDVSWMTRGDVHILELLERIDTVATPLMIAYEIDYSREHVSERLQILAERGVIERPDPDELPGDSKGRSFYRITGLGRGFLSGNIAPEHLE